MELRDNLIIDVSIAFSASQNSEVRNVWFEAPGTTARLLFVNQSLTFVMGPEVEYVDAECKSHLDDTTNETLSERQSLIRTFSLWDYDNTHEFILAVVKNWLEITKPHTEELTEGIPYTDMAVIKEVIREGIPHTFQDNKSICEQEGEYKRKRVVYDPKTKSFKTIIGEGRKEEVKQEHPVPNNAFSDLGVELTLIYDFIETQLSA